jgi:hypothetical protein
MESTDSQTHFPGPMGGDIPDLSDILLTGERLCFVARGRVLTSRIPRFGRWYIIVTSRRLVLLRDEARAIRQQWHVALGGIEGAYQSGLIRSKIVVRTRHGKFWIRGLNRFAGAQLVSWLVSPRAFAEPTGREAAPMSSPRDAHTMTPPTSPAALLAAERVLDRIEDLESDVERLTRQVKFLEDLLESKQTLAPPPQQPRLQAGSAEADRAQ